MKQPPQGFVRSLHRSPMLRKMARRLCRGWTIRQRFYQGQICLDAVDHAWAWTGSRRYESFDRWLQDGLVRLAAGHGVFLDLGANVGVMTLAVLLRTPRITAVAVEPNPRACQLLTRSLALNGLTPRARVRQAAVTPAGDDVTFDFQGSVTGHVAVAGPDRVSGISPAQLLAEVPAGPVLAKLDVEGYEMELLPAFAALPRRADLTLVFELHPAGFRPGLDPARILADLRRTGAVIATLDDRPVAAATPAPFDNLVARWPAA